MLVDSISLKEGKTNRILDASSNLALSPNYSQKKKTMKNSNKETDYSKPKKNGFNWLLGYSINKTQEEKRLKKVDYGYKFLGVKSSQYQTLFRSTEN